MAGAYTQLHIHAVTPVKFRQALIDPAWEEELYQLMGSTLVELGHHPIIINGVPDHTHLLWDHNRTQTIANTMKMVKGRSSKWINDKGLTKVAYRWQPGYGAFAVSANRVQSVKRYIAKQKAHHGVVTLHQEYQRLLTGHGVTDFYEHQFAQLA